MIITPDPFNVRWRSDSFLALPRRHRVDRTIRVASLLLASWLVPVGGCVPDQGQTPALVVRDSSGVTIVVNREGRPRDTRGWRLADRPAVDIGARDDPAHQLFLVNDALRLADGRIVVANSGTGELRFYSAEGVHLHSIGGEGRGPDQFGFLAWVETLPGDTLVTWDRGHRRLSIFDRNGGFVRSFNLKQPDGAAGPPEALGVFADGSVLARAGIAFSEPVRLDPGLVRRPYRLFRFHPRDGRVEEIDRFPGREFYFDGSGFTLRAFARWVLVAVGDSGFHLGRSERYEIQEFAADGTLKRIIRALRPNRPVTRVDRERFIESRLAEIRDPRRRQRVRRAYAEMPFPETLPAYSNLLRDPDGNLWVEDYGPPGGEPGRWTVFGPEGVLSGSVEVPARFSLLEVGTDYVLGRALDDLDVEHVRLHRLLKP